MGLGLGALGIGAGGGGGSVIDYSTSEQNTGQKWIDGKAIYQKTVNVGVFPNAGSTTTAHGVTGIDIGSIRLVDAFGDDGSNNLILPYVDDFGNQLGISVDATNIKLLANFNCSAYSGYTTIRYTKT